MKTPIKTLMTIAAAAGLAVVAHALPVLTISDGTTTVTDTTFPGGVATFNGPVGLWSTTVAAALTHPAIGSPTLPRLDITVDANFSGSGTGMLTLTLTDAFGPNPPSGAKAGMGGSTAGSVIQNIFYNGGLVFSNGPFTGSGFGGSTNGGILGGSSYTLGDQIVITQIGPGFTSADALLSVPDSGTTALLMALGLAGIGLGAVAQRRKLATA